MGGLGWVFKNQLSKDVLSMILLIKSQVSYYNLKVQNLTKKTKTKTKILEVQSSTTFIVHMTIKE